jgi:hypothetical protein
MEFSSASTTETALTLSGIESLSRSISHSKWVVAKDHTREESVTTIRREELRVNPPLTLGNKARMVESVSTTSTRQQPMVSKS